MSAAAFPKTQYFIVVSGSLGPTGLGSVTFGDGLNFSLKNIQLWMQKVGAHVGGEQFRISFYSDSDMTNRLFSSSWLTMADFSGLTASHWFGYATFDFAEYNINNALTYYIGIEAQNYTKDITPDYYWAVAIDWPLEINDYASATYRGASMSLLGLYV